MKKGQALPEPFLTDEGTMAHTAVSRRFRRHEEILSTDVVTNEDGQKCIVTARNRVRWVKVPEN